LSEQFVSSAADTSPANYVYRDKRGMTEPGAPQVVDNSGQPPPRHPMLHTQIPAIVTTVKQG